MDPVFIIVLLLVLAVPFGMWGRYQQIQIDAERARNAVQPGIEQIESRLDDLRRENATQKLMIQALERRMAELEKQRSSTPDV